MITGDAGGGDDWAGELSLDDIKPGDEVEAWSGDGSGDDGDNSDGAEFGELDFRRLAAGGEAEGGMLWRGGGVLVRSVGEGGVAIVRLGVWEGASPKLMNSEFMLSAIEEPMGLISPAPLLDRNPNMLRGSVALV
jgi:hypothetical protein